MVEAIIAMPAITNVDGRGSLKRSVPTNTADRGSSVDTAPATAPPIDLTPIANNNTPTAQHTPKPNPPINTVGDITPNISNDVFPLIASIIIQAIITSVKNSAI